MSIYFTFVSIILIIIIAKHVHESLKKRILRIMFLKKMFKIIFDTVMKDRSICWS